MRLLASESYNIAWFKLADFVARGEKERALSVHRLLMHSVQDQALPYQLEGDILLAFDDDAALDRYHIAANLYKKSGKFQQAISVYEHVSFFKEDEKILEALLDIYVFVKHKTGTLDTFSKLAKVCLQRKNLGLMINLLHRQLLGQEKNMQAQLSACFVKALLLYDDQNKQITSYINQAIDLFQEAWNFAPEQSSGELQKFLVDLKMLNKIEHKKAELYLKNNF